MISLNLLFGIEIILILIDALQNIVSVSGGYFMGYITFSIIKELKMVISICISILLTTFFISYHTIAQFLLVMKKILPRETIKGLESFEGVENERDY
jgi:hypothetical protein